MPSANNKAQGAIIAFFGLVCVALCITTIVLISTELYPGSGYYQVYYPSTGTYSATFYVEGQCLMTNNSVNVCRYGYAVGAIGACSSIVLMLALCAPPVVSVLMALFNFVWFMAWGITSTVYSDNIEGDDSIPQLVRDYNSKYRHDVYALAWTMFAVSVVSLPLALMMKKKEAPEYGGGSVPDEKPLPGTDQAGAVPAQPAGYPAV